MISPYLTTAQWCQVLTAFSFECQGWLERIESCSAFCLGLNRMFFFSLLYCKVALYMPSWLFHFLFQSFYSWKDFLFFLPAPISFHSSNFSMSFSAWLLSWSPISSGKPTILVSLGCCHKLSLIGWLRQQTFISLSSRGCKVKDKGTRKFAVWWELSSRLVDSHLLNVQSYGLSLYMHMEKKGGYDLFLFLWGH